MLRMGSTGEGKGLELSVQPCLGVGQHIYQPVAQVAVNKKIRIAQLYKEHSTPKGDSFTLASAEKETERRGGRHGFCAHSQPRGASSGDMMIEVMTRSFTS